MRNRHVIVFCLVAALLGSLALSPRVHAQESSNAGTRIWNRLQQLRLLDAYFPDVAEEVGGFLVQAAPGQWRGVQVNSPYRAGWLNLYLVDALRIRDETPLADAGVPDFTREKLGGGAMAHEETGIVFVNTAAWKRMAAAAVIKTSGAQSELMAAIATVDVAGLQGTQRYWSAETLTSDAQPARNAALLVRGAFAFVLAHEMGHLRIGRSAEVEAASRPLAKLTERQKDERRACPDTLSPAIQQQQRHEAAADQAAVQLLGRQCRIGNDGELRHRIYTLGAAWYFTFAMADKLLQMARYTSSPFIERMMKMQLGPQLYERAIVDRADSNKPGSVRIAFPTSHPPDYARWQQIEGALARTPCGGSGISGSGSEVMEMFRVQMCKSLGSSR